MRLEYIKRTTKTNRQELLNKALNEELEELRKKWFKYKRRPFLYDDIVINETNSNGEYAGLYEYDEEEFEHHIYIDKRYLRNYNYYIELKKVIRHELIHAFVKERYQRFTYIKNVNYDASPIFLAVLTTMEGNTNHDCFKAFCETDLYYEASVITDLAELDNYIKNMIYEYNNECNKIRKIGSTDKEYSIDNEFSFAGRVAGLIKKAESKSLSKYLVDNKLVKFTASSATWEIGCCVTPEKVSELFYKKQESEAEIYTYKENFVKLDSDGHLLKNITLKEKSNLNVA